MSRQPPIKQVLAILEGVRPGSSGVTALCPAHDDARSSLSVSEGADGRVLLPCFAGCDVVEILAAMGLEFSDLFPRRRTKKPRRGAPQHGIDA
jgi:putative DNA primase/helicase